MTTSPLDYNQQLLASLQSWRQLLEQSMTLMGLMGTPGAAAPNISNMMPAVPSAAPAPSPPPVPADYTQQLFGYLQAWRQYLEQVGRAVPALHQPPAPPPVDHGATAAAGGTGPGHRPPDSPAHEPVQADEWKGRGSGYDHAGKPGAGYPPYGEVVEPSNVFGGQLPETASLYGWRAADPASTIMPPAGGFGSAFAPGGSTGAPARAVRPAAAPQTQPSLYGIAARRVSPRDVGTSGIRATAPGLQRGLAPAAQDTPAATQALRTPVNAKLELIKPREWDRMEGPGQNFGGLVQ